MYSWSAANTAGETKKKCTSAALFVGQSVGNIVGPLLYKPSEAPEYFRGLQSNLLLYCAVILLVALAGAYLSYLNKEHGRRRSRMGKTTPAVDYSVLSTTDRERLQARERDIEEEDHEVGGPEPGARAFDDLTDLENEDFIFVF